MATLADLFEDTPAAATAAKPAAPPRLTVVPAAAANVIPAATQAERDAEAKRIQEGELARLLKQLQAGPAIPTKEEQEAAVIRTQGDVNALQRTLKQQPTNFAAAPVAPASEVSAPAQSAKDVGSFSDLFETTVPANQPGSVVQKPVAKPSAFTGTRGDTGIAGSDGPIAQAAL